MANTKVTGDVIANGTISTVHLADDAITAAKLDSTATGITFADLTVDTDTLYVDAANNRVGIGTGSPTQGKVDILDAGDYDAHTGHGLTINSNANNAFTSMYMGADDSVDAAYIQSAGRNTSFTSKKLLLNPNGGNVGIGTTSPDYKLEIESTSDADLVSIKSTAIANNTQMRLGISGNDSVISGTGGSTGNLVFKTYGSERMRIDTSGNVGIGSVDADSKFKVELNPSGTVLAGLRIGYNSTSANIFDADTQYFRNGAGTIDRMRIDSSGQVGIGTTTPNAKLDILGASSDQLRLRTAESEEYKIGRNSSTGLLEFYGTQSGYTGYVFGGVDGERMRINSVGDIILKDYANIYASTNNSTVNSGIYFGGTDNTLRFYTSNDEKMRIDSGGNLNILNATATNSKTIGITNAAGTTGWTFGNGVTANAHQFVIYDNTAGSPRMLINSSGNVGIGTTSPESELHIKKSEATCTLTIEGGKSSVTAVGEVNSELNFGSNDPSATGDIGGSIKSITEFSNGAYVGMGFYTAQQGRTPVLKEAMRIDYAGNVGIGTDSPSVALDVTGEISSSNDINAGGKFVCANFGSDKKIAFRRTGGNNLSIEHDSGRLYFYNESTSNPLLTMLNGGNVGIGTTSPQSKLDARGALMVGSAAEDGNFSSTTATGMSNAESGVLEITQGWVGSASSGDTVVFRYDATQWKSWGLEWNFMSTNGMSSGFIGGYNNNSTGHSNVIHNNAHGVTVSFSNSIQNNIITFTFTALGTHPMASFRYYQSGGDGRPYPSKASITINS